MTESLEPQPLTGMTNFRADRTRSIADWLGIAASTACAMHCILIPTLLVTGTVLPAFLADDETFHIAMLWAILPAAIVAFGIGCWRHKDRTVLALGLIGLTGITLSATVLHDILGEAGERIATLISAVILITAHYRNFRACRASGCEHEPE